jgi:hypothetical protein
VASLQDISWNIPISLVVKHATDKIVIEFGVNHGILPTHCLIEELLLFKELEDLLFLYGFDDF